MSLVQSRRACSPAPHRPCGVVKRWRCRARLQNPQFEPQTRRGTTRADPGTSHPTSFRTTGQLESSALYAKHSLLCHFTVDLIISFCLGSALTYIFDPVHCSVFPGETTANLPRFTFWK